MIWLVFAILAAVVAIGLLQPLRRGTNVVSERSDHAMAIYEDQLTELDRDADRRLISQDEARAAKVEIKRRMLASGAQPDRSADRSGSAAIVAGALFVPLAAIALYTQIGNPTVPAIPFADRVEEQRGAQQLDQLIAELVTRLESDPDGGDPRGWELLASTYMNQGRPAEAAQAYARLAERADATSATFSQYAEALITAERGVVTPLASRMIARAAELDPSNPAATYYRSIELEQDGQTEAARDLLLARIAKEDQPQPWMATFLQTANQMGEALGLTDAALPEFAPANGPSQQDIAAAAQMSDQERQDFIRSMVDGLEARLQDTPDDLDGWIRLSRALQVLGETDRAVVALTNARPLAEALPETDPRRAAVLNGLAALERAD